MISFVFCLFLISTPSLSRYFFLFFLIRVFQSDERRKEGRPKLRWLDCTENDLESMRVKRWRKKAEDRSGLTFWRRQVNILWCHFVHLHYHMKTSRIEPEAPQRESDVYWPGVIHSTCTTSLRYNGWTVFTKFCWNIWLGVAGDNTCLNTALALCSHWVECQCFP